MHFQALWVGRLCVQTLYKSFFNFCIPLQMSALVIHCHVRYRSSSSSTPTQPSCEFPWEMNRQRKKNSPLCLTNYFHSPSTVWAPLALLGHISQFDCRVCCICIRALHSSCSVQLGLYIERSPLHSFTVAFLCLTSAFTQFIEQFPQLTTKYETESLG